MGQTALRVLEIASQRVRIDQLSVHEDMAGKGGPLVGPAVIEEFVGPYYRKVWDMLASRGAKLFAQDSDGNMEPIIPAFLDAGVNVMFPMEPGAGMDMVDVRRRYGKRLAMVGGLDKFALLKGRDVIRAELEYKMQAPMQEGGVVFGADHRIPEDVKLEDFWYYVRTAREMLDLDPYPRPSPWRRLAF
jgi:uroporphyrinogen-III decarboxylase